jgi:hypothetical protein
MRLSAPLTAGLAACVLLIGVGSATAQSTPAAPKVSGDAIAKALPAEIPEVHSGGSWQDGGKQGIYRAVVTAVPGDGAARVFVQWIALKAETTAGEIVATSEIKEVAAKRLPSAFINLEVEQAGEIILIVASFDPGANKDSVLAFKASTPGKYVVTEVPQGVGSGAPVEARPEEKK